ncbi:MAG: hypothetical protein SPI49_03445 [Eubacteriales bacterium]|nr:hypothetical protein [Eubacteriales bacterium]
MGDDYIFSIIEDTACNRYEELKRKKDLIDKNLNEIEIFFKSDYFDLINPTEYPGEKFLEVLTNKAKLKYKKILKVRERKQKKEKSLCTTA